MHFDRNYINGQWQPPLSGRWMDNTNPATAASLGPIPGSGPADVEAAVAAALAARRGPWAGWSVVQRAELLDRAAAMLLGRAEELARVESEDTGKPVALARHMDIARAIDNFRFFAGAVRHQGSDCFPMAGALNYTHHRPVGVVALITPWNLPLYLLSWKTAPALAMGNTIVAKPSELTPRSAAVLTAVLEEAGLPPGVFNLVQGTGPEVGAPLVAHPSVSAVSFTGGTATGARVAAAAAPQFKKLSLELGGKNPTVVFEDADWEAALAGAVAAGFRNQGQICLCGSRLLVQRSIAERFVAEYVDRVRALRLGDPAQPQTEVGALISEAHRAKVEGAVARALEEGGELRCGGARPEGLPEALSQGAFYLPTVISGLPQGCSTVQEEIFGPVVTVQTFEDEAEALALCNGVRYGLAASVWTRDLARAHRFAQSIESGMVWVNTWLLRDLRVPFGGVKDSGVGREGGRYSLEFFSESRNICIRL